MLKKLLLAIGFAAFGLTCAAGQTSSPFVVQVNLTVSGATPAQSICTSQSLSEQANALVKVVCANGQFVSISANPSQSFLGTHGSAFRYNFAANTVVNAQQTSFSQAEIYLSLSTVTGLRVDSLNALQETLEMLVSF
jgi:hypothetical protein